MAASGYPFPRSNRRDVGATVSAWWLPGSLWAPPAYAGPTYQPSAAAARPEVEEASDVVTENDDDDDDDEGDADGDGQPVRHAGQQLAIDERLAALFALSEQRRRKSRARSGSKPRQKEAQPGAPRQAAHHPQPAVPPRRTLASYSKRYGSHSRAVREGEAWLNTMATRIADGERPRRWPLAVR